MTDLQALMQMLMKSNEDFEKKGTTIHNKSRGIVIIFDKEGNYSHMVVDHDIWTYREQKTT